MSSSIVATYVEQPEALMAAQRLAESLRTFGGAWRAAPFVVYLPEDAGAVADALVERLAAVDVEIRRSRTPEAARWFYYGGKPYAAAQAEADAAGGEGAATGSPPPEAEILVWLDLDTVILDEPREFALAPGVALAYCPVMHNRSGTRYDESPDPFWRRIYELLALTDEQLFPMITPADHEKIRAYFHCGHLALRPAAGILRHWARDFSTLAADSTLLAMCRESRDRRIFLHQTALTSAVLHRLERAALFEFSPAYNYPIFFDRLYGADQPYASLDGIATARCLGAFGERIGEDWTTQLAGPEDRIAWLGERQR
jgi:hypothetical protein